MCRGVCRGVYGVCRGVCKGVCTVCVGVCVGVCYLVRLTIARKGYGIRT